MTKYYNVAAEVHKQLPNGSYRVKVRVLDDAVAMTINGMIVWAPGKKPKWTVYTPSVFNAHIVEFAGASPLWQEIREECINAVRIDPSLSEQTDVSAFEDIDDKNFQEEFRKRLDEIVPF